MSTILITGGTGFIGSALSKKILSHSGPMKLISFSRRWNDSEKLERELNDSRFRSINGDICDYHEILSATKGVDYIIHAAAYKSVPSAEYNPFECKRVNVDGTENVIKAAIANGVKRVLFISSDKACDPFNTYGRTKALGESLMINANNLGKTRFSVARYGNIINSTGSVVPFFEGAINREESLSITDSNMTRFWFDKGDAVRYVLRCLRKMKGGEVFIPKLKSSGLLDLVEAMRRKYPKKNISYYISGTRPGEKSHEAMISHSEAPLSMDCGWTYIIAPFQHKWDADLSFDGKSVDFDSYTSENSARISVANLAAMIA